MPARARDVNTSVAMAGQLVTLFASTVLLFGPVLTAKLAHLDRKTSSRARVVQPATVGFVAHRHACDVEVADADGGLVLANLHGHTAFNNLAVVQGELHHEVGRDDGLHGAVRFVQAVQEAARGVAGLKRSISTSIPASRP